MVFEHLCLVVQFPRYLYFRRLLLPQTCQPILPPLFGFTCLERKSKKKQSKAKQLDEPIQGERVRGCPTWTVNCERAIEMSIVVLGWVLGSCQFSACDGDRTGLRVESLAFLDRYMCPWIFFFGVLIFCKDYTFKPEKTEKGKGYCPATLAFPPPRTSHSGQPAAAASTPDAEKPPFAGSQIHSDRQDGREHQNTLEVCVLQKSEQGNSDTLWLMRDQVGPLHRHSLRPWTAWEKGRQNLCRVG
eukprot:s1033_g12.t1